MKINEIIVEGKPGLWANIHKKQERIKGGSGERMRKPGSKGAPTAQNFKDAASEGVAEGYDDEEHPIRDDGNEGRSGKQRYPSKLPNKGVAEGSLNEQFDVIEEMVEQLAEDYGVDSEAIWEYFENIDDNKLFETAAWQKKAGKNKNGGLNAKGVASYRRENPGSKLQTAVTTKPSKLKPGSKAAKRRKSFCARMSGMKGPMKDEKGKPTRKALSLRKWNC